MNTFGVTRLARVTGLDTVGIPVWSAIRPNAKTLAQSQGKGIDDAAAAASALMESIEVATAERDDHPHISASIADLVARGAQFEIMDHLRRSGKSRLMKRERTEWMAGLDLISGAYVYVPKECVVMTDGHGRDRYWQSTDGLASGNTVREAIFHGLCERIERDATALWLLRTDEEVAEACVDHAEFGDHVLDTLIRRVEAAHLQVRLFDLTSDLGIPVFAAYISPPASSNVGAWSYFDLSAGYGCHPIPARAAIRALTEAAQTRLTTISGARDDFDPSIYADKLDPSLHIFARCVPRRQTNGRRAPDDRSISRSVEDIVDHLRQRSISPIVSVVLDDRQGEFAVVKTLAPLLEGPPGDRENPFGPRAIALAENDA
ncbi:MAG: YcaO-like family protein [Methylobacteriaceae bacterium]|nr:YcaO-like family protein [Methylobacteriaceae bacterium]